MGFVRLLVPLDPRRYYELGQVADADFSGRCLDVSSPKLLPSLLQAEGRGSWVCIDLFDAEIDAWRTIDPALELDVQDATALTFPDQTFDNCICVSVLEHIARGRDSVALSEIWRVLKPGGALHLTTDVAAEPQDVFIDDRRYGRASPVVEGRGVFFKHDYSPPEVELLITERPWEIAIREFAALRNPRIERWFDGHRPWSYVAGPFLRFVCPSNFDTSPTPGPIEREGEGVVYLRLVKPRGASE